MAVIPTLPPLPDDTEHVRYLPEAHDGVITWESLVNVLEEELYAEFTGGAIPEAGRALTIGSVDTDARTISLATAPIAQYRASAQALGTFLGVEESRANQLIQVAQELTEQYSPDAPTAIKSEAILRISGYLNDREPGHSRHRTRIGDYETETVYTGGGVLLASGAASLLSPWKVRRAGVI